MKLKISTFALFIAISHALSAQLPVNGGFENDLNAWSVYTATEGAATFSITTSDVNTGSKSLEVSVSDPDSVVLTQSAIAMGSDSVYTLRFRATSGLRGALLDVHIRGEHTNTYCSFKIYDRFDSNNTSWQMYDFCFKSKDAELSVDLVFKSAASYLVDQVELIGNSTTALDLDMQLLWQNNRTSYGWVSADNDASVPLPDGRTAWIFSDTFLGWPDPNSNILNESTMVNNIIVVQEGTNNDSLRSVYKGTQSSPTHLWKPNSGLYWITDGVVENDKLIVVLNRWDSEDGDFQYQGEAGVATHRLPDLEQESLIRPAYSSLDIPNAILEDVDYYYIYTVERVSGFEAYSRVARVKKGELNNPESKWEFFTSDGSWVSDNFKAKRIISNVETGSVLKLGPGNYVMSGVPRLSSELAVWFAPSPMGPWGHKTVLYNNPSEEGVLAYFGHLHEGTERDGGVFTLSYSLYPFGGGVPQQLADRGVYIPRFVKADIRNLSPYKDADCMGVTGGTAYIDDCGDCVGGTSESFPCFPGPEENMALGKPVTSSSQHADFPAVSGNDGDYQSYWESEGSGEEWLEVDLEDTMQIVGIRLVWESSFKKDLELLSSVDAVNWESLQAYSKDSAEILDLKDLSVEARYIKLRLISNDAGTVYRLDEFEIYAKELSKVVDITDMGGSISAQYTDSPGGEDYTKLIDNDLYTKYLTFHSGGWVQFSADTSYILKSYTLASANDAPERDPATWNLEASADGINWKAIDVRYNIDFPARYMQREFTVANDGAYSFFRFNLRNVSGDILQLSEIELFGIPTALPTGTAQTVSLTQEHLRAYPNPFNEDIQLDIYAEQPGTARFSLYTISGMLVNELEYHLESGWNSIKWQGLTAAANQGLFILKTNAPGQSYPVLKLQKSASR